MMRLYGPIAFFLINAFCLSGCGDDDPASDPNANDTRTEVVIPRANFFPAGLTIDGSGNLYVGSLGTGEIVRIAPLSTTVFTFVPPDPAARGRAGLLVRGNVLWACDISLAPVIMMQPATSFAVGYDLASGSEIVRHAIPGNFPLCNDLTFDSAGNLYISESAEHRILRITAPNLMSPSPTSVESWQTDAIYSNNLNPMGLPLSLNGIAFANGAIYANNVNKGEFYRIPIGADGSPGAVEVLASGLSGADGMRLLGDGTSFMLVQNNATPQLTRIVVAGATVTTSAVFTFTAVQAPASVEVLDGAMWVTESQLPRFLGIDTTPATPFKILRVSLDDLMALGTASFDLRPAPAP